MHQFEHDVKLDVEARVRQGVKAVLEEVLEEEMTEHLKAGYRELTPTRRGERNGYYQRNLVTPAGKIERLEVPRDREGEFVTDRKSTRLNSSHANISYAVFCLKKKKNTN